MARIDILTTLNRFTQDDFDVFCYQVVKRESANKDLKRLAIGAYIGDVITEYKQGNVGKAANMLEKSFEKDEQNLTYKLFEEVVEYVAPNIVCYW